MNPNSQPIKVNIQQLEANLRAAQTELALWERRLETMIERGQQECLHVRSFCKSQGYEVAHPYLMAIKADYESQANLVQLSAAKLQSQIEIMKAMLEECKKTVVSPGAVF
jgi:hypothetical protein